MKAQVQHLQATNEKCIQHLDIMSTKVKQLEDDLQYLQEKKLELQNQLQATKAS